jgi:hypothetical protein
VCVLSLDVSNGKEISYKFWPCKPFVLIFFITIGISTQDLEEELSLGVIQPLYTEPNPPTPRNIMV